MLGKQLCLMLLKHYLVRFVLLQDTVLFVDSLAHVMVGLRPRFVQEVFLRNIYMFIFFFNEASCCLFVLPLGD